MIVNQENVKQIVEELALKLGKVIEWQEKNENFFAGSTCFDNEVEVGIKSEDLPEVAIFLGFIMDLYHDRLWKEQLFKNFFRLNPDKKIYLFLSEEAEKRKGPGRRKQIKYFLVLSCQGISFAEQKGKEWYRNFAIQNSNDMHQQLFLFYRSNDQFKHTFLRVVLEYARQVNVSKLVKEIGEQIIPPEMPQDLIVPVYDY